MAGEAELVFLEFLGRVRAASNSTNTDEAWQLVTELEVTALHPSMEAGGVRSGPKK